MKYKRLILGLGAMLAIFAGGVAVPAQVMAAGDGCGVLDFTGVKCSRTEYSDTDSNAQANKDSEENISSLLVGFLRIMNVGVGIAAVGALIYAGILYSTASGDANKTAQAKTVITNVVIGILAYAVMGIALNFLVPGGILR